MKVLEEGKWKNPWSLDVVCGEKECGAKLRVDEKDVKAVDYRNDYVVECPICGGNVSIAGHSIPLRVKRPLDNKRKYSSCYD